MIRRRRLVLRMVMTTGLAATLAACQSIDNPNVRAATYLPDGPPTTTEGADSYMCPDGWHTGDPTRTCPTAEEAKKAAQERTSHEILDIHAHGG